MLRHTLTTVRNDMAFQESFEQRKGESIDRYLTRLYNAISTRQRCNDTAVKFVLREDGIDIDTFYGLN